jgi:NTE family protein
MPANLAEAGEREKDIRYSSRTRLNTTYELRRQATLQAARRLVDKLPPSLRNDPDAQALAALPVEAAVAVAHLIYRSKHYESQSKDYEFSRASMLEHWAAGMTDTQTTLEDPRWLARERHDQGVHVFDMTSPSKGATKTITPSTPPRIPQP